MNEQEARATALKVAAETAACLDSDHETIKRADVFAAYILTGENHAEDGEHECDNCDENSGAAHEPVAASTGAEALPGTPDSEEAEHPLQAA